MGEVKYIMKSVPIWIKDVIGQGIPNENTIPPQITLTTLALRYFYLKMIR